MNKYFTLQEAERALHLVSPIVQDILRKMKESQKLHDEVKREKSADDTSEAALLSKLKLCEKMINEIEYHMHELESVGVFLKDLTLGIVDFPSLREGHVVYLCWMLGEEKISYWHEIDRGFAARKLIDERFSLMVKH